MSDRCEHGTVIDAVECTDCVIEELERLKSRVEQDRDELDELAEKFINECEAATFWTNKASEFEREKVTLTRALEAADLLVRGMEAGGCAGRCEPCIRNIAHYKELKARAATKGEGEDGN